MAINLAFRSIGPDNDRDILNLIALIKRNSRLAPESPLLRPNYWKRSIGHSFISLVSEIGGEIVAHSALRLSPRSWGKTAILMHRFADSSIQDFEDEAANLFSAAIKKAALANGASLIITGSEFDSISDSASVGELEFHKACIAVNPRASSQKMIIEAAVLSPDDERILHPSDKAREPAAEIYERLALPRTLGGKKLTEKTVRFKSSNGIFFEMAKSGLGSPEADIWLKAAAQKHGTKKSILLNLEDPGCASLGEKAERLGARFTGVLPIIFGFDCAVYNLMDESVNYPLARHSLV